MSTASVTHTFTAGTTIQSVQANTNFSDIITFLNNNVAHLDASKTFTGTQAFTNITAVDATFSGDISAVDATFSGDTTVATLSLSGAALPVYHTGTTQMARFHENGLLVSNMQGINPSYSLDVRADLTASPISDAGNSNDARMHFPYDTADSLVSGIDANHAVLLIHNADIGDAGVVLRQGGLDWGIFNDDTGNSLKIQVDAVEIAEFATNGDFTLPNHNTVTSVTANAYIDPTTGLVSRIV